MTQLNAATLTGGNGGTIRLLPGLNSAGDVSLLCEGQGDLVIVNVKPDVLCAFFADTVGEPGEIKEEFTLAGYVFRKAGVAIDILSPEGKIVHADPDVAWNTLSANHAVYFAREEEKVAATQANAATDTLPLIPCDVPSIARATIRDVLTSLQRLGIKDLCAWRNRLLTIFREGEIHEAEQPQKAAEAAKPKTLPNPVDIDPPLPEDIPPGALSFFKSSLRCFAEGAVDLSVYRDRLIAAFRRGMNHEKAIQKEVAGSKWIEGSPPHPMRCYAMYADGTRGALPTSSWGGHDPTKIARYFPVPEPPEPSIDVPPFTTIPVTDKRTGAEGHAIFAENGAYAAVRWGNGCVSVTHVEQLILGERDKTGKT
jgi:hypothetical protein